MIVEEIPGDCDIGRIMGDIYQPVIQVFIGLSLWRLIEQLAVVNPHVVRVLQVDQVSVVIAGQHV